MLTLFVAIAAAVAAGVLIAYVVKLTIHWLRNKIRTLLAKKNVKKVAATKLEKLIEECPNEKTLDELYHDDYDMVIASVNESGTIEEVEVIKDESTGDIEVDKLLGKEEMVVVTM